MRTLELLLAPYRKLIVPKTHTILPKGYDVAGELIPEDHAILAVANHVGWWDGFLLRDIHRQLAGSMDHCVIMTERELRQVPIFRHMGAYGIQYDHPSSLRWIMSDLARRRADGPFWLSLFPQGTIRPAFERPLQFQTGLRLICRMLAPVVILPIALVQQAFVRPSAEAWIRVGKPFMPGRDPVSESEHAVTALLDQTLAHFTTYGEAASAHWVA